MKRWISLSLLLSILAMLICVPAAAPAETKVTLNDDVSYSMGKTKISWRVSGDEASNYIVLIQAENGKASQQLMRVGETTSHSIKAVEMLPGKKYTVLILDDFYRTLAQKTYEMPEPEELEDGKLKPSSVKVSVEPRKIKHNGNKKKDTKKISEFDSDEIIKGLEKGKTDFGVKYTMKMPQLKKSRDFFVTIVFEAPNGFLYPVVAQEETFDRVAGGYQTLWFYMIGDSFFSSLYKNNDDIPTGKYKIHLYWDGMWVNTSTFKVY